MFFNKLARPGIFQQFTRLATIKHVEPIQSIHTTAAVSLINRMKDRKSLRRAMPERDDGAQGSTSMMVEKRYASNDKLRILQQILSNLSLICWNKNQNVFIGPDSKCTRTLVCRIRCLQTFRSKSCPSSISACQRTTPRCRCVRLTALSLL